MACGLPIISTTRVGAAVDLIKDGLNGVMVEDRNTDQLCQAMRKILSNPELKHNMGIKSQQIIDESFKIEHAVAGFMSAVNYAILKLQ
jgi:glycosyltransferase involved in cell wall biosynthesis